MQLISCHEGRLLTLEEARLGATRGRVFRTGLKALDAAAPGGAFARGSVHELLSEREQGNPRLVATVLARSTVTPLAVTPLAASRIESRTTASRIERLAIREPASGGSIIWCDPHHELYPPALAIHGIPLEQLFLLRPKASDQIWAIAECLRCKGVSVVVAAVPRLTRVEARRLQLAAESGGGVGILLRPAPSGADVYAAATRWLVRPTPGERTLQRWTIQLLHGHGGRIGQTVTLEYSRENNLVRAIDPMADRQDQEASQTAVVARAS